MATGSADNDEQQTRGNAAQPEGGFDKVKFGTAAAVSGVLMLLLFLCNLAYIFGSTFGQTSRNHAYTIAAVNYDVDNSSVWQALTRAYETLKSDEFFTLAFEDPAAFPDTESLVHAVREQKYWGAVMVSAGASARLANATLGDASSYDNTHALSYVWNEIRYPAVSYSVIQAGILQLQSVAVVMYQRLFAEAFMENIVLAENRQTAFQAFLSPFQASEINIQHAPQPSKVFYNTIAMVFAILQQNLFLIAHHAIAAKFGLFKGSFRRAAPWALGIGLVYTLTSSLMTTACIYAFREGWVMSGGQFMVTWMAMWFVSHIYYQLIDGTLCLVPMQLYSLIIITFVIVSVTATIFPLESSAGFYRWGMSLPTLHVFQLLLDIWCDSSAKLYQSLPILFSWWVVGAAYSITGVLKKVRAEAISPEGRKVQESTGSQASAALEDNPREEAK